MGSVTHSGHEFVVIIPLSTPVFAIPSAILIIDFSTPADDIKLQLLLVVFDNGQHLCPKLKESLVNG